MSAHTKLTRALAIAVAVLQIPLLMLWKIILRSIENSSGEAKVNIDPLGNYTYELVFQWEKFIAALLIHFPFLLALTACFVLAVVGLISVFRQKRVTVPMICFYAVTCLACGFLCIAFARPAAILGSAKGYMLMTYELTFFRYFGGMELRFDISLFSLLKLIKYVLLGLMMVGSGVLCGLGLADMIRRRKAPPAVELLEPTLYQL